MKLNRRCCAKQEKVARSPQTNEAESKLQTKRIKTKHHHPRGIVPIIVHCLRCSICNTHHTLSSAILSCGSSPARHLAIELYLIKTLQKCCEGTSSKRYKNAAREAQDVPVSHKFSDPFKTSANQRRNASGGSKSRDFVTCSRNQATRYF